MSIASEITRINNNIAGAYTACNSKGATMPASGSQNSANLATTISSIPAGGGGGVGITREVSQSGVYQMPTSSFTFSLPSNATSLGDYALYHSFYNCTGLTSIDCSSLTILSGTQSMYEMCRGCANLVSIDFSNVTDITSNVLTQAFYNCTSLSSIDFSSLTSISANARMLNAFRECSSLQGIDLGNLTTVTGHIALQQTFYDCTSLSSATFTNLESIGINSSTANYGHFTNCFHGCTNLTSITFPNLKYIYCTGTSSQAGTFKNNDKVEKLYFPKLTTITYGSGATFTDQAACKLIFADCSALTELHFGAANQSAIEASAGYSTLWGRGAGNATVYFDL